MAGPEPSGPEIDPAVARRLFKEYVAAKRSLRQSTGGLTYGKMVQKLRAETSRLQGRLGADVAVRFEVRTVDGKVRLRAMRDTDVSGARKLPGPAAARPAAAPQPRPAQELDHADLDHDDLDAIEPDAEADLDASMSVDAVLAQLRREEDEPPPVSLPRLGGAAPKTGSFATLGDIAKRMTAISTADDAASRPAPPAAAPEPGAPVAHASGDSIPISLEDDDPAAISAVTAAAQVDDASVDDTPPGEREVSLASPVPAPDVARPRGAFSWGLAALLLVLVGGGAAFLVFGDEILALASGRASTSAPASAPSPRERPPPTPSAEGELEPAETGAPEPVLEATDASTGQDPDATTGDDSDDDRRRRRRRDGREPEPPTPPPVEVAKPVPPVPDCSADPRAPGCPPVAASGTTGAPEPGPDPVDEAFVPEKLSQNQLRDGFQWVKSDAKLCGQQYGATPGEKVSVQVAIQGSTGGITQAVPQDPHAATALGKCVAEALQRATFSTFSSPTMSVTWTIKM